MPGSCFSSEKTAPEAQQPAPQPASAPAPQPAVAAEKAVQKVTVTMTKKVFIIYYSTYGHVEKMARALKEGVDSVEGVEGVLYRVAETLPDDVLAKMHAPPKPADIPVIDPHVIDQADGFAFGIPTRFGIMAAQMKAFWDATGGHWQKGSLVGKPATVFVSTATQGGGQETTHSTTVVPLVHHGMIYVPTGYSYGGVLFGNDVVRGGSAWGAGTLAGADGSRAPSEVELGFAKHQGTVIAKATLKLAS